MGPNRQIHTLHFSTDHARRPAEDTLAGASARMRSVAPFRHRPAGRNGPRPVARRSFPRLRNRTERGVLRQLKHLAARLCQGALFDQIGRERFPARRAPVSPRIRGS